MTPQELSVFEDNLLQDADRRLALLDKIFLEIYERMLRVPEKDLKSLLKYHSVFIRVFKKINYLERFRIWHKKRRQSSDDLNMALLFLEADSAPDSEQDRSSIKTKKIYSKFPPRQAFMDLTDEQWQLVQHLLPQKEVATVGRPPQSMREVLDAILWKIRTGAPWDQIPPEYPSHQTCYRYYTAWTREECLDKIIKILARDLRNRGGLDIQSAAQSGEIQITRVGRKAYIVLPPRLQDTWRGSTALVILQFLFKKLPQPPKPVIENRPSKLANIQELIATRKPSQ
jgi:transposase